MTDKELGEWRDFIQSAGLSPSREKGLLVFIGEVKRMRDERDAAKADEREGCARVAESYHDPNDNGWEHAIDTIASAIRART